MLEQPIVRSWKTGINLDWYMTAKEATNALIAQGYAINSTDALLQYPQLASRLGFQYPSSLYRALRDELRVLNRDLAIRYNENIAYKTGRPALQYGLELYADVSFTAVYVTAFEGQEVQTFERYAERATRCGYRHAYQYMLNSTRRAITKDWGKPIIYELMADRIIACLADGV